MSEDFTPRGIEESKNGDLTLLGVWGSRKIKSIPWGPQGISRKELSKSL